MAANLPSLHERDEREIFMPLAGRVTARHVDMRQSLSERVGHAVNSSKLPLDEKATILFAIATQLCADAAFSRVLAGIRRGDLREARKAMGLG